MSEYILSCDTMADLSEEQYKAKDIHYIYFHFELDGKDYYDDLGKSVPFEQFYKAMQEGADTKTSQISIGEYLEFFEQFLEQGKDVLMVTLSTGLSATYNSAVCAARIASERFPERKIRIVDSLSGSAAIGVLVDKAADMKAAGMDIDELAAWIEANRTKAQHWFFTSDLKYLIRGGRVSKAAGTVANVLGICPVMAVDNEGRIVVDSKARSKKKAIEKVVAMMEKHAENGYDYDGLCVICQALCMDDARELERRIKEKFPKCRTAINYFGTGIGSHTGPGTMGAFFWGDNRDFK